MKVDIEKLLIKVPIVKINSIKDNEVFAILEKYNICGSVKIKTVYWILKKAIEGKKLNNKKIVLEASSGNTGVCLAYLSNLFNLRVLLIIPKNTAIAKKNLMKFYGAQIIEIDGVTDDCIDYRKELYNKDPKKYFLLNQYDNEDNVDAHYNLTGPYIKENLGKIDFFVAGFGTTGTLLGTAKYLKSYFPQIKIIGINPLDKVEGLKNYKSIKNIGKFYEKYSYLIDEKIDVCFDEDAIFGMKKYFDEGNFVGISSGAILSGAMKYIKGKKGLKGVIVAPDSGDFYFPEIKEKIFG